MKRILFFICLLIFNHNAFTQSQNLRNLGTGDLISSHLINDDQGEVFGYLYVYLVDRIDKATKKYEYVILDKNLNISARVEFEDKKHKRMTRTFDGCEYQGESLVLKSRYFHKRGGNYELLMKTLQVIDYETQTISEEYYSKNGAIHKVPEEYNEILKQSAGYFKDDIVTLTSDKFNGFATLDRTHLTIFDKKVDKLWDYNYKTKDEKGIHSVTIHKAIDDMVLLYNVDLTKKKEWKENYLGYNIHTGDKIFEIELETNKSPYRHLIKSVYTYDDKIYILGDYSIAKNEKRKFNPLQHAGMFELVINKKGEEIKRNYKTWTSFSTGVSDILKGDFFKSRHFMSNLRTLKFKDGKSAFLFNIQKWKTVVSGSGPMYHNLGYILVYLDADFNEISITEVETEEAEDEKKKAEYFIYSQYLDNGIAFFTKKLVKKKLDEDGNKQKSKEWILGINTLIDGKFTHEEMIKSSKDYFLNIIPAKKGYIIMNEFNDDENSIRLEKLNY